MKPQSSEGLILKQIDFHEYDKIITLLTKDQGKKTGVLKGAKRINSAHLGISEPFTHVNVQYVEKPHAEMVRIRKLGLLNSFYPIRLSYEKILYASYFAEWIHLCVIDPQEALHFFDLLLSGLENLQPSTTYTKIRVEFEKKPFEVTGNLAGSEYLPRVQSSFVGEGSRKASAIEAKGGSPAGLRARRVPLSSMRPSSFRLFTLVPGNAFLLAAYGTGGPRPAQYTTHRAKCQGAG